MACLPDLRLVTLLLLLSRKIATLCLDQQTIEYKHNMDYDIKFRLPLQWELKGWVVNSLPSMLIVYCSDNCSSDQLINERTGYSKNAHFLENNINQMEIIHQQ